MALRIRINPSERWLLMGNTGSGKTEFSKFLLRPISTKMPVAIVDTKHFWLGEHPVWEKNKEKPGTIDRPHLVTEFNPKFQVQVIQPDSYDEEFEEFCRKVRKHKNIYFYIDENAGLCTATMVPTEIDRIWRWGRVLNVGAADGSQTYGNIPKIFKSQSEWRVLFRVGEEDHDDAAKLVHVTKQEVAALKKWEYIVYNPEMERGIWNPPILLPGKMAA
jgi:energy-coupling factor transporter ATP-binding protein EcfA2